MNEFEKCVKRGGLKLFPTVGPDAIERELRAAREDLADAEFLFEHEMPKRTTITAYYSMFHAARAGVLAKGYAEKSHYCLLAAFREFYAEDDEGSELARGIERARFLRENADYHAEFSMESARAVLEVTRRFVAFVGARVVMDTGGPTG